ncbi:hypothetical protein [Absidia glauca]|uniref:Uncharacterized protein n=1 Tax=Absidia glauca TaxID=4829 RepID=A0A170AN68_ABSGL|nr:hypothetical protein [Absidia glauca]
MGGSDSVQEPLTPSCSLSTLASRPVPFAVLKVQFKRLVEQHQQRLKQPQGPGVIATKDLLTVIDAYEHEHDVLLLTTSQKKAIHPYTLNTPDLEMTPDDILNLLKLVFVPPSPVASLSAPTSKLSALPRTSAPLKPTSSSNMTTSASASASASASTWKRRLSTASMHSTAVPFDFKPVASSPEADEKHGPEPLSPGTTHEEASNQHLMSKVDEEVMDKESENDEFAQCYRRSLALTQRLKLSEKSLASMTRDNEDRIVVLQNRVDDMTNQVNKQKRELMEYKSKESNSLEQISMLESHIDTIQQSETDQKQVYLSIKALFDEKCGETQKLQELLREKESDLQKAEAFLSSFHHEFMQLTDERNRLKSLQQDLERELATSHHTHTQLAEQRSENERLKQVIDTLKCDLDQARHDQLSTGQTSTSNLIESLEAELEGQLQLQEDKETKALEKIEQMQQTEERLKSAENEKNYYKSRATEAMEDLDRVKDELSHLKKALDSENRLLVNELEDLQTKTNLSTTAVSSVAPAVTTTTAEAKAIRRPTLTTDDDDDFAPLDLTTAIEPYIAALPINTKEKITTASSNNAITPANSSKPNRPIRFSQQMTDVWSQSRIRGRKLDFGKKREVFDLHSASSPTLHHQRHNSMPSTTTIAQRQHNDKLVTSTATFAIYTLLVYIFGIVTSTFLIENGPPGSWEQALVAAAGSEGGKSKLLDILLYWIEKLLFEGEGVPLS